jgi:hypothetical protein
MNEEIKNLKVIDLDSEEQRLFIDFEKEIDREFVIFCGEKDKRGSQTSIIDMLKMMELKLEELIAEIKFYKADKKMSTTFKDAEHKCI